MCFINNTTFCKSYIHFTIQNQLFFSQLFNNLMLQLEKYPSKTLINIKEYPL